MIFHPISLHTGYHDEPEKGVDTAEEPSSSELSGKFVTANSKNFR